jgi:hypothetical protein
MREFLRIVEVVRSSLSSPVHCAGADWAADESPRENASGVFPEIIYDLPATKVLIENRRANPVCDGFAAGNIAARSRRKRRFPGVQVFAEKKFRMPFTRRL